MMHDNIPKADILDLIKGERQKLEGLIQKLSYEQLTQLSAQGEWSIKDIVVHLAVWEERGTEWIKCFARGVKPDIPMKGYTWKDYKKLNQQSYEENQSKPWEEVLAYSQKTFKELINTIDVFPESNLELSFNIESSRIKTVNGRMVIYFRYLHYHSHLEKIQKWIESLEK
ncbi:MAG: DinB family protein [Candidatus Thorarchaeota archaeon]